MGRPVFVFIKCDLGKAYDVAVDLVYEVDPCPQVYSISGEHDLIAQFHLPDEMDIGKFVTSQVQTLPGVRDTNTMIAFNTFANDKGFKGDKPE
ncbi:MAG: Lrp/AsnC ligand binding domain-containing protein [Pseudomonadota bacterium]